MFHLLAPLIIGFLGSLHCLGMCGPLIAAYALNLRPPTDRGGAPPLRPWQSGLFHHLAFHSGRLLTYGFLGTLASGLVDLVDVRIVSFDLRTGMTLLGGGLMVLSGLVLLRIIPSSNLFFDSTGTQGTFFRLWLPSLIRSQHLTSKIGLGMLTGFLPCMVSWSMVIQAATTGDLLLGFLTMALFGLGTVPLLLLLGVSASMISIRIRLIGERTAASAILFMGLILIFKGVRALV
jgi:sulfite exporter TauE/SafE